MMAAEANNEQFRAEWMEGDERRNASAEVGRQQYRR